MDSTWLDTRPSSLSQTSQKSAYNVQSDEDYIPAWKMPISKSFSSALSAAEKSMSESSSGISSGPERDTSASSSSDPESCPLESLKGKSAIPLSAMEEEGKLIHILLPCIICNRTFAPEALERHSKVCNKVNAKSPYKPDRGKFESAEQRKKGTKAELFIPPPALDSPMDPSRSSCFSRGSKNRNSLRGTSCTTRSTLSSESLLHHNQLGFGPSTASPLRRQRSMSQARGERGHSKTPSEYLYDDHSEFGSNSEESTADHNLPSYAKPIAPTDECPYCSRCFGLKAYDRHVQYCQEKHVSRQYDIQPVPKEKIEALERQEVRTKYRPMKGSSSCTSLRSGSPGKDFASMAYKLFGLRRTDAAPNLYNNQLGNFKKSNESLTNSCYGDFTRGMRRPSPSPSTTSVNNKINNLFSKTFQFPSKSGSQGRSSLQPMKINTTSNIPMLAKSTDNLPSVHTGQRFAYVPSSGYGQGLSNTNNNYNNNSNSFNRNSRSRSSLHKNFFRSKRVEPEGTENTGTPNNMYGGSSSFGAPTSPPSSPLIITPMTFYSKANKGNNNSNQATEFYRPQGSTLLSQDPSYDPYEVAAKQLEELLKAQPPVSKNVNRKTARKLGLEKAFESVGFESVHADIFPNSSSHKLEEPEKETAHKIESGNEESFVFGNASGKMDDTYWDEILRKGSSMLAEKEKSDEHPTLSSSEAKSQVSEGGLSDMNKSRAMSQISSADSGFSRSDGQFEALESFLSGRGEDSRGLQQRSNALPSLQPPVSRAAFLRRQLSDAQDQDNPVNDSTTTPTLFTARRDSENTSSFGARFCHECGNSYPSSVAKFCSDCGEKRVFK